MASYPLALAASALVKWFTSPIPAKNINLNFLESAAIKEAFTNPNDKGV
jgi:glutamate/aspartate transport system substrate-binding protein